MAMMGGMVGMFIKSFALTMVIMTSVSLFISFTLTPILCSVLLKPRSETSRSLLGRLEQSWNRMLGKMILGYRKLLHFNERHRWAAILMVLFVTGLFVHSLTLAAKLGSSMANDPDRGEIFVKLEFPTRYSLDFTVKRVQAAENRLRDLPELRRILSTIGKVEGATDQSSEGVYLAQILLRFNDRTDRKMTIDDLLSKVRSRMTGYPDSIVTVGMPSFMGGQQSEIEMEIAGDELTTLDGLALKSRELSEGIPGLLDVDTSVRAGKPELRIHPQRALLADLNSPVSGMGMVLRANLEGLESGTFKRDARNYDIVVKLEETQGKNR
jgi:HAE1 family hydrophobic/amphiphilic exporter-1